MSSPSEYPLRKSLAVLLAVASSQLTGIGFLLLSGVTWLTFAQQEALPIESLWPLLLVCCWLMLILLTCGTLAVAAGVCYRERRFAGPCATCVIVNAVILMLIAGAIVWDVATRPAQPIQPAPVAGIVSKKIESAAWREPAGLARMNGETRTLTRSG